MFASFAGTTEKELAEQSVISSICVTDESSFFLNIFFFLLIFRKDSLRIVLRTQVNLKNTVSLKKSISSHQRKSNMFTPKNTSSL